MDAGDRLSGVRLAELVAQIADDAEVFHRLYGPGAANEMLRSRRATEFDPALVDLFCAHAGELLDGVNEVDAWDVITTGARDLGPELSETKLTKALRVFADYADLKSPSWLGHSAGVAALAAGAASRLGLPAGEINRVERAALVHDLGAIGVSTGVWDKPAALSAGHAHRRTPSAQLAMVGAAGPAPQSRRHHHPGQGHRHDRADPAGPAALEPARLRQQLLTRSPSRCQRNHLL